MDFSSLVLMEINKTTREFVKELGSYEVGEGAEYVTKMYFDGENIKVFFDTKDDVEEWEFSAIFDLFNKEAFEREGFVIEDVDDEYNPTWKVEFDYIDEHAVMQKKLAALCEIIKNEMQNVRQNIIGKEDEYR